MNGYALNNKKTPEFPLMQNLLKLLDVRFWLKQNNTKLRNYGFIVSYSSEGHGLYILTAQSLL